jgi:hypothetical protein
MGDIVRNFNWGILVYCLMEGDESLVLSSNLKGLPVQVVEHRCYAVLVCIEIRANYEQHKNSALPRTIKD